MKKQLTLSQMTQYSWSSMVDAWRQGYVDNDDLVLFADQRYPRFSKIARELTSRHNPRA